MALPIAPVVRPTDLAGQSNGKLAASLLTSVSGSQLHHLTARAWKALVAAAWSEAGMGLTYTLGGMYRSYSSQETLFRSRYTPNGPGGGCKTWNGVKWCKKSSGLATAATPGTSNHGWGLAIDTAYDDDLADGVGPDDAAYIQSHPSWPWFLANAGRFGFSWELQSEPWHIRYITGDYVPQAVLDFENPPKPVEPTKPTTPTTKETLMVTVFQPNDCSAEFIGMTDVHGNALEVEWISTAEDQRRRDAHIGAGANIDRGAATKGKFKNCTLTTEVPHGDSYPWTPSDFHRVRP